MRFLVAKLLRLSVRDILNIIFEKLRTLQQLRNAIQDYVPVTCCSFNVLLTNCHNLTLFFSDFGRNWNLLIVILPFFLEFR